MILSILYIILALLGIGFLIFIHELGHYFMAKRAGIRVEAFAIGFGKPIVEWEKDGVKWRICWLPFGGYVQMAGMEKKGLVEPHQIKDGFFGATPWNRIKVALAGPVVNIVFALFAFTLLWMAGGRYKSFAEYTHYIGWVQPDSNLYESNVRPGDEITRLNNRPFKGFNDFLYGAALDNQALTIQGKEIDYAKGTKAPFTYVFDQDSSTDGLEKASAIVEVINPAQYLIFSDEIPSGSPWQGSGIEKGDRILWANGGLIFSKKQLIQVLNSPKVLLTIDRDGEIFQTAVPRLQVRDLRLKRNEKNEIDDWAYDANLSKRIDQLAFIPYSLSSDGTVEEPLGYVDEKAEAKSAFEVTDRIPVEIPLLPGDRIVAVQGDPVTRSVDILKQLQIRKNLIIVKGMKDAKPLSFDNADAGFVDSYSVEDLKALTQTIGTDQKTVAAGNLKLLSPITPKVVDQSPPEDTEEGKGKQTKALEQILKYQTRQMLGIPLFDRKVTYNPNPFVLFGDVLEETYRTFVALVTGVLSPKHMSGPIGIVQVIQYSWSVGAKEALFWLGMISLNLGLLNLLPIPVLDGGHIVFSIWEAITKKPIPAKTREKLIWPFVILLIAFFVYVSYHDIARLIKGIFS